MNGHNHFFLEFGHVRL